MNFRRLLAPFAFALLSVFLSAQNARLQPTVITCDGLTEIESTDTETTFTLRDNVRVTATNMKLNCDYLQVVVVRTGDKLATLGDPEKFRSLIATGHVLIVQGDREAACGRAEVLPREDKIVLTEKPVVVFKAENSRIEGEVVRMYRGQRRIEIDGMSYTGPAVKDLGFDEKAQPTAPAAEAPKQP
jgi:lipopolysaccharide export system protein LptA